MEDIYAKLVDLNQQRIDAVLCILTETSGSSPRKAGSKMIVAGDGETYGTVGGGKIEHLVIAEARQIMGKSKPEKIRFNLKKDADMECGGTVEVYLEPSTRKNELIIFGVGHVGASLAKLAKEFGFEVTAVDNRPELFRQIEGPRIKSIEGNFEEIAKKLETDEHTFLVVTTPKHSLDFGVTAALAAKPSGYLGMIGSHKKVKQAIAFFREEKSLSEDQIKRIDMPIGIPFNAQTPKEVALSILARIIDVRNSL